MRPRLLLTINCKFAVDFFARGLHTRTAVARSPLRQLGFFVTFDVSISKPRTQPTCIWTERRQWKKLSLSDMEADLRMSKVVAGIVELTDLTVDELPDVYDNEHTALLDKHYTPMAVDDLEYSRYVSTCT